MVRGQDSAIGCCCTYESEPLMKPALKPRQPITPPLSSKMPANTSSVVMVAKPSRTRENMKNLAAATSDGEESGCEGTTDRGGATLDSTADKVSPTDDSFRTTLLPSANQRVELGRRAASSSASDNINFVITRSPARTASGWPLLDPANLGIARGGCRPPANRRPASDELRRLRIAQDRAHK